MNTLATLFQKDHEHLDAWLACARREAGDADAEAARAAFDAFRSGIERHIAVEESLLLPAYEARQGVENPLTSTLRKGHRDLKVFFAEMQEALVQDDLDEFLDLAGTVAHILEHHDRMEEDDLYPVVAQWLPDNGQAAMAGLQAR